MALNHKYTLVCDEVRQENNGKFIVIGVYTPGIVLPRFPTGLPKLTFFNCFEPSENGAWDLGFQLRHVDTGAIVGPDGRIKIEIQIKAETGGIPQSYVPITIPNIQFQMPGMYAFTLNGANFEGVTVAFPVTQQSTTRVH